MVTGSKVKRFGLSQAEKKTFLDMLEYNNLSVGSKDDPLPVWRGKLENKLSQKFKLKHTITTNTCTTSIAAALSSFNLK